MSEGMDIVRRYFSAFAASDVDEALRWVAPDAVWHVDGDPVVGTVGIVRGRDRIGDWLRRFPDNFQPLAFTVEQLIDAGRDVIALGHFRHRVMPTGAIVDSDYAIRFTIAGGLIARYQIFEDSLLIANAFADPGAARSAVINGTTYGWQDTGNGKPIIFLHGLFLDADFWARQVADLAGERRCIAFDMPGHRSSGWRPGLDLDGIAEDISLWIVEHGAAPATIVGHSQGSMIALRIAAHNPELIDRLVLVNTSARAEPVSNRDAWIGRRQDLLAGPSNRAAVLRAVQELTTAPSWIANNPDAVACEHAAMMRHAPEYLVQALDAAVLNRPDIRSLLSRVAVDTVILSGSEDVATPPELGREIATAIPGAQHFSVDGAAHHVPSEAPDAVTAAIRADSPLRGSSLA